MNEKVWAAHLATPAASRAFWSSDVPRVCYGSGGADETGVEPCLGWWNRVCPIGVTRAGGLQPRRDAFSDLGYKGDSAILVGRPSAQGKHLRGSCVTRTQHPWTMAAGVGELGLLMLL